MALPLTNPNPDLATLQSRTVPGMAHWASSGPVGTRCGGCAFFTSIAWGTGRSTRCEKFKQMMGGKYGSRKLPEDTASCKYYEAKAT